MTTRSRLEGVGRLVAWAWLLALFVFLIAGGGGYFAVLSPRVQLVLQLFIGIPLAVWFAGCIVIPIWRPQTPLLLPVALAAAAYAIAALLSQRPRLSLEPTLAGLAAAAGFLLLTRLLVDPWFRQRISVLVIAAVSFVAVAYVVQVLWQWVAWWMLIGRFAIPPLRPDWAGLEFGSPNIVGTFLILAGPLAVILLAQIPGRRRWALALGVAAVLAIFLTGSRGAYLGVAAGALVATLVFVARVGARAIAAAAARFARRPAVVAATAVALVAIVMLLPAVILRFAQGGETLRVDLWRSALAIFADRPLTGGGPGTWPQLKIEANPPGVPNLLLPHAHDMFVQLAAEVGIVGILGIGLLVGVVLLRLGRTSLGHGPVSPQAAAVLIGLVGFGGQSLVDNLSNLPVIVILVALIVAWVDAAVTVATVPVDRPPGRWSTATARLAPALALLCLVLVLPATVQFDRAKEAELVGNDAARTGDWPRALVQYETAVRLDPAFTLYQIQEASMLARTGHLAEARATLTDAVQDDPAGINLISLASLDMAAGDVALAKANAERATTLAVGDPTVALNAGIIEEQAGDSAAALADFAAAVAAAPSIASSPFWDAPERVVTKADVVAAALTLAGDLPGTLIQAYAGDPADAASRLAQMAPSAARDVYLAVVMWLGGDPQGAASALQRILNANPQDWVVASWLYRVSRAMGDDAAAATYADWVLIVQNDAGPAALAEQGIAPDDTGLPDAGLSSAYPWGTYDRPISPYLIAPGLAIVGGG